MSVRMPSKTNETRLRTGAVLAMVMVSLMVASMLGLALIETVLVHYRQMHVMGRQQQCFWLAEAGIQRAIQRLADSADYQGEEWEVSSDDLGSARSAVVAIEVTPAAGSPPTREILVEARLADDPVRPIACRRELTVPVPNDSEEQ